MQARHEALRRVWLTRNWFAYLLWPLASVYGRLLALRALLYRWRLKSSIHLPVPVVVVGNVVVGGTGKTPIVIALVEHLIQQGWKPGVVSRGYGRDSRGIREVDCETPAQVVGDEPALIWQRCQVPVFVGENRGHAAHTLLTRHPACNVIVSDDGLQHLALVRDIEIVVFDDRRTGNGFLIPAGPLREPWPRRADFLLYTGQRWGTQETRVRRRLSETALRADGHRIPLERLRTHASSEVRIAALAAIAQPESFFQMLRAQGIALDQAIALPDHALLDPDYLPTGAEWILLCTEKDAVKLWPHRPDAWAVPLICELPAEFLMRLDALLQRKRIPPYDHV